MGITALIRTDPMCGPPGFEGVLTQGPGKVEAQARDLLLCGP